LIEWILSVGPFKVAIYLQGYGMIGDLVIENSGRKVAMV
jgi:hypothetical protein